MNHKLLKFRLRTALVVPFVLETAAAVGLVGYLSFHSGYEAVRNVAQQLQLEVSEQVEQHLDQFMAWFSILMALLELEMSAKSNMAWKDCAV
jgi:hypothetical protein